MGRAVCWAGLAAGVLVGCVGVVDKVGALVHPHRKLECGIPKGTEFKTYRIQKVQIKNPESEKYRVQKVQNPKSTKSKKYRVQRVQSPKGTESHKVQSPKSTKSPKV